jgi:hypothetical protein
MNGFRFACDVMMLLVGGTGLLSGLNRLASAPLWGVLIIVSAMVFLLFPAASLCGANLPRSNSRRK